jgi:hypothetical protein
LFKAKRILHLVTIIVGRIVFASLFYMSFLLKAKTQALFIYNLNCNKDEGINLRKFFVIIIIIIINIHHEKILDRLRFYSKTKQMHNISNLFNSETALYMFQAVSSFVIMSPRLYEQHQVYVIGVM